LKKRRRTYQAVRKRRSKGFRYGKNRYCKWECPNIEVERKKQERKVDKRYSKKKGWCSPYRQRYRNIAVYRICP